MVLSQVVPDGVTTWHPRFEKVALSAARAIQMCWATMDAGLSTKLHMLISAMNCFWEDVKMVSIQSSPVAGLC
jgi:hypothetical protein